MPILIVAIAAMLIQQTVATTAKLGLPAIFPAASEELGFDPEFVLVLTAANAAVGILVMAGCGGAIRRWGALRVSQVGCVLMAAGMAAAAILAQPWLALGPLLLAVLLNSSGSTVATPASSQILQRYAPPKWAPLVFSIKQTGVPMGLAISGLVLAPLAHDQGWRFALLALAVVCLLIGAGLQPVRKEFDQDRDPHAKPSWTDFPNTIREVLASTELRLLAGAAFVFVGIQAVFMAFTITYFTELGYKLDDAGVLFGIAVGIAVPARIFWGWLGSTYVKPRHLLAFLAVLMAGAIIWMGWFDKTWSWWELLGVSGFVSLTVLSWHGILLSEAARLAPAGHAGRLTGGVLAFGSAGQIIFPLIFGIGLRLDGHLVAYIVIAIPALFVAQAMLRPNRAVR